MALVDLDSVLAESFGALRALPYAADAARLEDLATRINACLAVGDRARPLAALVPRRAAPAARRATRERPALLASERAPLEGPAPLETLAAPLAKDDGDPTEESVAAFFAARRAPPSARPAGGNDARDPGALVVRKGGHPEPEEVTLAELVRQCADTVKMLARHRAERPWRELAENEAQLLTQTDAIAVAGGECARTLVTWWKDEEDDPWSAWAAPFALASLDGLDVLTAIARALEDMGEDRAAHGERAADALSLAPHPHVADLARELAGSPNPIARAAGVEVLARRALLSPDEIRAQLCDANPPVLRAAIRAARALPPSQGAPLLGSLLHHPDGRVAWPAARQLMLWGRPEPMREVRAGRLRSIGQRALEVIVQLGAADDLPLLERVLARAPSSKAQISAVARFGSPRGWAFLVHHLADDELADDAARALVAIFGPRVSAADTRSAGAWRKAISQAKLSPDVRYRRGEPWSPRAICAELRRGDAPRGEAWRMLDELAVRTATALDLDLARWSPDASPALASALDRLERVVYEPGTWKSRA